MNTEPEDDEPEKSNAEYLRDLSDRLRHIPVMHGVDGYDIDRLQWIADELEVKDNSIEELLG